VPADPRKHRRAIRLLKHGWCWRSLAGAGLGFAADLRRNPAFPPPQLVLMGSIADFEETGQWLSAGIAATLAKPVRQGELLEALADALDVAPGAKTADDLDDDEDSAAAPRLRFTARVLVAEDNPVNQELAATLLVNLGCEVEVVGNGREAVERIVEAELDQRQRPVDLILMDMQMPELDGRAAAAAIRRHEAAESLPRLPIVALTANALDGDRERCLAAGMDDYLAKPFSRKQLTAVLGRWLPPDRSRSAQAAPPPRAAAPASAVPESPLDPRAIARIRSMQREGAPSVLARVIGLYLESAPQLVAQLREAVSAGNASRLQRAAHSLKSGSANLGALALGALCRELEAIGESGTVDGAAPLVARVTQQFESVRTALTALRDAA